MSRLSDLKDLYSLMIGLADSLGGFRTLDKFSRSKDWPERGVYFFFDQKEPRSDSGAGPRLVRVGTHALITGSKASLRQRLGQHRGNLNGGGNHRGSIFRLLVGQALLASDSMPSCNSWGVKSDKGSASRYLGLDRQEITAAETPVEQTVSKYIAQLPFVWLAVSDEPSPGSLRGVVEKNSIALLSNCGRSSIDAATRSWLGHHSDRKLVRESGLWNQNHTTEHHAPGFLRILEKLIQNQMSEHE